MPRVAVGGHNKYLRLCRWHLNCNKSEGTTENDCKNWIPAGSDYTSVEQVF